MTLPKDVQEALDALAENLAQSEPLIRYRRAQARLDADRLARQLLERLSGAQAAMRRNQASGAAAQPEIDELRALQRQVQTNATIVAYAEAQRDAAASLPTVNEEISQLLGLDFAALAAPASC